MAFERLDYGRLTEFTGLVISVLGETVCVMMDDNRRIGACHRIDAGQSLSLQVGAGQEKHSLICICVGRYDIYVHIRKVFSTTMQYDIKSLGVN